MSKRERRLTKREKKAARDHARHDWETRKEDPAASAVAKRLQKKKVPRQRVVLAVEARPESAPRIRWGTLPDGDLSNAALRFADDGAVVPLRRFCSQDDHRLEVGSLRGKYTLVCSEEIERIGYSIRGGRNLLAGSCVILRGDRTDMTEGDLEELLDAGHVILEHTPAIAEEWTKFLTLNPGPFVTANADGSPALMIFVPD